MQENLRTAQYRPKTSMLQGHMVRQDSSKLASAREFFGEDREKASAIIRAGSNGYLEGQFESLEDLEKTYQAAITALRDDGSEQAITLSDSLAKTLTIIDQEKVLDDQGFDGYISPTEISQSVNNLVALRAYLATFGIELDQSLNNFIDVLATASELFPDSEIGSYNREAVYGDDNTEIPFIRVKAGENNQVVLFDPLDGPPSIYQVIDGKVVPITETIEGAQELYDSIVDHGA